MYCVYGIRVLPNWFNKYKVTSIISCDWAEERNSELTTYFFYFYRNTQTCTDVSSKAALYCPYKGSSRLKAMNANCFYIFIQLLRSNATRLLSGWQKG